VFALGDGGDLLERRPGLLAQDPPASTGKSADTTEILFVLDFELLRVPHIGSVDHEGVRRSSYVLLVATATAAVGRAAGVIVVKDDIQSWAVLNDLLETRMELLD
jgi:hypothetical protein